MNKKFSTLVAALLVSGASFAMVSAFDVQPLTASPIAKAATANLSLRSTTGTLVGQKGNVTPALWHASAADDFTLNVVGEGNYVGIAATTGDLILSDVAEAAKFNYTDNHLVEKVSGGILAISKADGSLSVVAEANMKSGDYYYATLFEGTTQVTTVSSLANAKYTIAAEVKEPKAITTNDYGVKVTAGSFKLEEGTGDLATVTGAQSITIPEKVTTAKLVTTGGSNKYLQITSAEGTVLYMHVNASGDIAFTENNNFENDGASSAITIDGGNNNVIKVGANKYLLLSAGALSVNVTYDNAQGVYALATDDLDATLSSVGNNQSFYLLNVTENIGSTPWENATGKGNIVDLAYTAGARPVAALVASLTNPSATNTALTLTVKDATAGTFTLSSGFDYLPATAGAAVEMGEAGVFHLDPVDGALMCGASYLTNNAATLGNTSSDSKLYLYKSVANLTDATRTTVVEAGSYYVANAKVDDVKALDQTKTYVVVSNVNDTPDVPTGEAYKLDNATNYYLSTGGNYLLMSTDKALGNATSEPTSNTAGLWTAAKITNVGQQTYYSFTNLKYGKKLAFKAVYESGNWAVKYDPSGKYNTFFINADGQITFNVKEDANATTGATALNATYALDENSTIWGVAVYNAENTDKVTFKPAEETPVAINKVIELLNTTYGAGNGFGLLFKDKALSADGVKDVALEANPFTDANLITAVQGPATSVTGSADLSAKMFLKVSGSYPLSAAALANVATDKKAEKQLEAFRTSTFIAIDTVRYSSLVPDYDDNNFFKYTTVKGSSMLSKKGYIYDGSTPANDNAFKKDGNFEGITRRIQNAEFSFSQVAGSTMKDPAYFYVATAYIPAADNGAGLAGHTSAVNNQYITIKKFNNKYYVGAGDVATRWDYVYVGLNNDVTYQQVNGIVNIVSRNYTTNGQIYANQNNSKIGLVLPKYVCTDKPEGQFLVQGGNDGAGFTFTNRESGKTLYTSAKGLKTVPGKEDVYAVVGTNDTILIASSEKGALTIGYQVYDQDKDLDNKIYNLRLQTNVPGMPKAYVTEKDHDATHAMGLDADSLNAATFKLVKFAAAKDDDKMYGDSLFVSYEREYSYVKVKDGVKSYDVKKDTVVAFTYAIYNADNKEYVAYNDKGANKFYYCNPDLKYNGTANYAAQKFIIKQKENGTYHLLPVDADFTAAEDESPIKLNTNSQDKLYGGFAEEGGKIDQREDIYETTYNDLFEIVEVGAPMYRTVEAAPFDTLRIYKEGMDNVALFAETAKPEIVSGENFLGMTHQADKDLNKTMFSLFVDTAYVNRADNYKPQYMLVLDADTVHGTYSCNIPSHGLHDNGRIDTVYGKYLINMKDSAEVWDAAKKHNNPYWWERNVYPRLAFVNAKHVGDNLIILNDNGIQSKNDTINLSDNSDKFGVYAFRIADREAKSFLIETAYNRKADGSFDATGWIKWLNGIPVVVSDMEQAEVFNFEATAKNPTANDAISTSSVSVVATDGAVIIKGAAGKTVAISNILGQTIANAVLSSDNETISAPAGVVVVAVEGEAAVKAIVK